MFRKVLIATPAATMLIAAVPLSKVNTNGESSEECSTALKCRRSDLPLYKSFTPSEKKEVHDDLLKQQGMRDAIESGVRVVRIEVQKGLSTVEEQRKTLNEYYETAMDHTKSTIDYLNEPQNVLPRSGAIAIGGFSGFIFAVRGGFIKKVLYTTIGAGAVASLCYPREAEKFAQDALVEARKGYHILYNFVKGVKPGDEMAAEPVNKFPTTLEDLKHFFYDLYDEAKEALFGKKK